MLIVIAEIYPEAMLPLVLCLIPLRDAKSGTQISGAPNPRVIMRMWVWAGVAQLVEHLICNQRVGGSNPSASSIFFLSECKEPRGRWTLCSAFRARASSSPDLNPPKPEDLRH